MQINMLREQLRQSQNTLEGCEAQYRQALAEFGIDEEIVDAQIMKARSSPQKKKSLQRIHEAYKAVQCKQRELKTRDVCILTRLYMYTCQLSTFVT